MPVLMQIVDRLNVETWGDGTMGGQIYRIKEQE